MDASQKNFNNNFDNEKVRDEFIKTSQEVAKSLKEHYDDQWVKPGDDFNSEV